MRIAPLHYYGYMIAINIYILGRLSHVMIHEVSEGKKRFGWVAE
jgi:hypothetical protein